MKSTIARMGILLRASALFAMVCAGPTAPARADQASATGGNAAPPAANAAAPAASEFRVYEIKQATAADLQNIIKQLLPTVTVVLGPQPGFLQKETLAEKLGDSAGGQQAAQPDSKFVADEFIRTLILSGAPADLDRAFTLLNQIDTAPPQVNIKARVMDVSDEVSKSIGVLWNFNSPTATFTLAPPARKGDPSQVMFGRLSRTPIQVAATLEAAIAQNRAKVLASPELTVLYNHRAEIFIGDEVTYLIGSQATINGANLQTSKVKIGVELSVVATAHPDGTITLRVHPEVGSLLQLTTLSNGVSLPTISRRFADTEVRVKNGETLVIGGLIGENDLRTNTKVPILGDLPLLGYLFRHHSMDRSKSEVVMFLTATIVKD